MYLRVCKIVYLSWLIWYYATFYTYMRILSNTIRFTYIYFRVKMRFLWSYDWTNTHVIQLVSSGKPRTIKLFNLTCYSTRIFSIYTYQPTRNKRGYKWPLSRHHVHPGAQQTTLTCVFFFRPHHYQLIATWDQTRWDYRPYWVEFWWTHLDPFETLVWPWHPKSHWVCRR